MTYQTAEPDDNPRGLKVGDKVRVTLEIEITHLEYTTTPEFSRENFTSIGYADHTRASGDDTYFTIELPDVPADPSKVRIDVEQI